jgi:DNA-binding transcriptional LysR family regulator
MDGSIRHKPDPDPIKRAAPGRFLFLLDSWFYELGQRWAFDNAASGDDQTPPRRGVKFVLNEMNVFVRAVELKSISAAARNLRLSAAAASHRILQLEEQVGARLLNRTTRSLQPTEAGKVFYEHAVEVLRAVERAESSVAKASGVPTGTLKVTAPLGFGRTILAPLVSRFHARYPKVDVRLRLSDHNLDLLSESVDLAIRMTDLPDSSFVSRKLADCPRVLCASPE